MVICIFFEGVSRPMRATSLILDDHGGRIASSLNVICLCHASLGDPQVAATSATTSGVAVALMQVEILPNGPRYRNHYMETNPPSLLIGVCIHTRVRWKTISQPSGMFANVLNYMYVLRYGDAPTRKQGFLFMRSNSCLICS